MFLNGCATGSIETSAECFTVLGDQLARNTFDLVGRVTRQGERLTPAARVSYPASGHGVYQVPTTRLAHPEISQQELYRGRCRVCSKNRSKYICHACKEAGDNDMSVCYVQTKRPCFRKHIEEVHGVVTEELE